MNRVVITGIGIVSTIGNTQEDVVQSLKTGSSGITYSNKYNDVGMKSCVVGKPIIDLDTCPFFYF